MEVDVRNRAMWCLFQGVSVTQALQEQLMTSREGMSARERNRAKRKAKALARQTSRDVTSQSLDAELTSKWNTFHTFGYYDLVVQVVVTSHCVVATHMEAWANLRRSRDERLLKVNTRSTPTRSFLMT